MARTPKRGTRIRRSRDEIKQLLADYDRCDLTQEQFALENGISLSTLTRWLRLRRKAVDSHQPRFVEFEAADVPAPIPPGDASDRGGPESSDTAPGDACFELVLADTVGCGIKRLRVPATFHSADLERLLESIARIQQPAFRIRK
jgi:hypothetical protein